MNILHIIPDISVKSGGPVATMVSLNHQWLTGGHAITVLTIAGAAAARFVTGTLVTGGPSFPARFYNSNEAVRWLAENYAEFDLCFIHGIWTALTMRAGLLLNCVQLPYVVIPHGSLDPFDLQKKSLLKRVLGPFVIRKWLAGSSCVLCSTQREADLLVTYGADCRKIVLPWPVSPVFSQITRQQARKALGLGEDEFVILSLGRIDYKKGFPVLLPAFYRLLQVHSKTRLLIVGPDSNGYLSEVQNLVQKLGLQNAVQFIPMVQGEDKIRVQRAADCFALPSLNENFGNTVVEAMQQGLPCVISNNVYICDTVESGGAGLVCHYDEREVFTALRRLAESQDLRATMSEAAIQTARIYDPKTLNSSYMKMLAEVVLVRSLKQECRK